MKKSFTAILPWILMGLALLLMLPSVVLRVKNEAANRTVVLSLYYNDLNNRVSPQKKEQMLAAYKEAGIHYMTVTEEDVNSLVARGQVTCIKLNVLKHKYDQESIDIAEAIEARYPQVSYDSYLVMVKNDAMKEKFKTWVPDKYTDKEFVYMPDIDGMDIYAYLNGREELWNVSLGYDEDTIAYLQDEGFDIVLTHKVKNYPKQGYLKDFDRIIEKYGVTFFNIKKGAHELDKDEKEIKANAKGIADLLCRHNMTLLVTESATQLSNEKCLGYAEIFNKVMTDGSRRVMRSYETYDDSHDEGSHYLHRADQYLNSTIDRNIRFLNITQIASKDVPYEELTEYTLKAINTYRDKITSIGYTIGDTAPAFDYPAHTRRNASLSSVIIVMMLLLIVQTFLRKENPKLTVIFCALAFLGAAGAFVAPASLVGLYATAFAAVLPCFAVTLLLRFLRKKGKTLPMFGAIAASILIVLAVMCAGGLVMGALLSGLDYYINNLLFRGIKISLLLPLVYTAVLYYFLFVKEDKDSVLCDLKKLFNAQIKVYWVILAGILGAVGLVYILRSGNVTKISGFEQFARSKLTDLFPQRPRTKEFLLGYPALCLFVFYLKKTNSKLMQWVTAVAGSILCASIINSFCHVFTDLGVIYMRVVNGLLLGLITAAVAYIANLILFTLWNKLILSEPTK